MREMMKKMSAISANTVRMCVLAAFCIGSSSAFGLIGVVGGANGGGKVAAISGAATTTPALSKFTSYAVSKSSPTKNIWAHAKPDAGYSFVGWATANSTSAAISSTDNPLWFASGNRFAKFERTSMVATCMIAECSEMTAGELSVNTNSTPGPYSKPVYKFWPLTNSVVPTGMVEVVCASADEVHTVYFFAKPNSGFKFLGWVTEATATSNDVVSTDNPYSVEVTGPVDKKMYAVFEKLGERITFISAKQRYPWNNKIDIEFLLENLDLAKAYYLTVDMRKSDGSVAMSYGKRYLSRLANGKHTKTFDVSSFRDALKDKKVKFELQLVLAE